MQAKRRKARATFSVNDMGIISKASLCLQERFKSSSEDLFWAMLVCPALFTDLKTRIQGSNAASLKPMLSCVVQINSEVLSCTELANTPEEKGEKDNDDARSDASAPGVVDGRTGDDEYVVPQCADGKYTGAQIIGAYLDACLTFYWIEKKWVSDVSMYSAAIPPTVMML
jgi:hypothetical protein